MIQGEGGTTPPTGEPAGAPPQLCIGLPVFNGEDFLEESIDSILDQSFDDFELIISDNASTDRTPEIVRDYATRDHRIRYHRHEQNLGASANYDSVWRRCRSPYFKWAAADDLYAPWFLERCLSVLEAEPVVGLAYPTAAFIGADSKVTYAFDDVVDMPDHWAEDRVRRTIQFIDALLEDGSTANVMVFGVIRSDVLRRINPIGNYFGADQTFMAELVEAAPVVEVPGTGLFLRRHDGSSSTYEHAPAARAQQDFYDPSVRGAIRLRWNLRRRYLELLKVMATAQVGLLGRMRLIVALVAAVLRRIAWRVDYERSRRRGAIETAPGWPGGPVHWSEAAKN
ncbi:MAG: glycosyltransferase family 2 protein [Actinomycetota bacterium]